MTLHFGNICFRWYMTLLSREFSMPDTLRIWDALLSDPKRFSFLHYVNLDEKFVKEDVQTIREAAMRGNLDRVEKLLDLGFSADAESAMGLTPLHAACQSGHLEVVRRLLSSGANVNHAHVKTGRTALMEAANRATPSVIKELLRYGARIYVEDVQGETVFDCIKDLANRDIIERACQVWSSENAALFPIEFRHVSLVYALVIKRQREAFEAAKVATRRELTLLKQTLQRECVEAKVRYDQDELCDQLQTTTHNEHFDTANGVSRDANGNSLATLDVFVQQGENLPYRDPRIGDLIDPYVRVFLRSTPGSETPEDFKSEVKIADRNPVWEFRCQIAVPSVQKELSIQVVDTKRKDVAGEVTIPLRSLLDQKDHVEWHVMLPTLRQQILEKKQREQPARIRVGVKLIHTQSIVLTRDLQQLLKTRHALVKKRRDVIQDALQTRLQLLP
eukprot:jgi/Phyca11/533565/estExt2_fgenesh1_pg.C_PHYCAscaffold_150030